MQEKYKIGNDRQHADGLVLRIVDDLPQDCIKVNENLDLEDVYLYYFDE